jgi:DNA invertase Pin-like site-specific DNA recombinase
MAKRHSGGNLMKKVVAYCRVSTAEQSIDSQLTTINKYCEAHDLELAKIYKDEGISGTRDQRPALDELKKDCIKNNRGWSGVIVFRFDRMARSLKHLISCLEHFKEHSIDFISCMEAIDTTSNIGKLLFQIVGSISEFEACINKERVIAGIKSAKERGVKCGRPRVGFDVHEALRLKKDGLSWSQLSKRMGVSSATLRRVIPPLLKTPHS